MKKGFTMIELIFVIVILGILAAVAVPRLAATRDDAVLAGLKTDINTALQAVPAWFQGQRDARIMQAIQLDTTTWNQPTAGTELYTWSDGGNTCVTLAVVDFNTTNPVSQFSIADSAANGEINATNGRWLATAQGVPVLRLVRGTLANNGAVTAPVDPTVNCNTLWDAANGLGLVEANITMAGQRVQW